ncbi:MAG: DAK2 domain-containing protein [Clostridiales bacterium]|nr:DAK2 domain-containing protein [Clostridiales bacterium]
MDKTVFDGNKFSDMIKGALCELMIYEKEIDDLNVFPVPDGDTGANMRRTLELGVSRAPSTQKLNEYLDGLSTGMLFGARGNSGVILSQIFKGIALSLKRYECANENNLAEALNLGYVTAYNTVLHPVEGTILTVLRDGVAAAKSALGGGIDAFLDKLITESKKVLQKTPEMLPVLKEAGVVDSGGFGLIKIYEGMLKAYRGEEIVYKPTESSELSAPDPSSFDESSEFTFGYCMEFTLQLLKTKTDVDSFSEKRYTEQISALGSSIVAIRDKSRMRVHIHTFEPEKVIALSRSYGEFVFFKLDNMALQHNETVSKKITKSPKHKELEIISVAGSDGVASVFDGLGSGVVIGVENDMNVSVGEFISAVESANAETVIILPNDKNVLQTANQAVKMHGETDIKVEILPTKSIAEGYFALASDIPDGTADERIQAMKDGAAGVITVHASRCTRNRSCNGVKCAAGEFASFADGKLIKSDKDLFESLKAALYAADIEEREAALVFMGEIDGADELLERLEEEFPDIQIDRIDGAFSDEKLVIGIV